MQKDVTSFCLVDAEFYAPVEDAPGAVDLGELYRPSRVPEGWRAVESGIWTMWHRTGLGGVEDGWKIHVSARPDRPGQVLDVVADVCFAEDVPFKHMSSWFFYQWMHHKHASRPQGGKFTALYPKDVAQARHLMERLAAELGAEEGPDILTDRRFGRSRVVHYRYGAFVFRHRIQADGTRTPLMRDAAGRLVDDRRGIGFRLPEGMADPFARPAPASLPADAPAAQQPPTGPPLVGGFRFEEAIRHRNGGGTYRARDEATGRAVFVKEARAHTGVREDGATAAEQLDTEWETLRTLHRLAPGLAPEPVARFRAWENEFMVTEFIEGRPLNTWMVANNPLLWAGGATPDDLTAYYGRCERVLAAIDTVFARLHALGLVFVDVSPGNVLVGDDDSVRLIDFEATHRLGTPFVLVGTAGYSPPAHLVGDDLCVYDDYGAAALALLLLGPFHQPARRNPDSLAHLRHALAERGPVPADLWKRATRFHRPGADSVLPPPEQVAADPVPHLADLRDRVADALVAMADPDHPARTFPTIKEGYVTNTLCVAYGTAGVVHALSRAGRTLPDGVLDRLRRDALATADELAPGFYVGLAGIARVLADHGLLQEATDLLTTADSHPLTTACATLSGGLAGVALAHLALHDHTRDAHHLDRALALTAALPDADDALTPLLGPDDATGLLHGRTGIALLLHRLAAVTGDRALLVRGVRLLHSELDRATDPEGAALTFPISGTDRRSLPYLYCGSAGTSYTVTKYLGVLDDERLAEAQPRLLAPLGHAHAAMSGLFQGLSGIGLALAEHAEATGDATSRRRALDVARRLFLHAVPHPTGVRFLGDQSFRFSADLFSGSAGVLLFLDQLLNPRPDAVFALDALTAEAPGRIPPRPATPASASRAPGAARASAPGPDVYVRTPA
ncbi:class III lanthionine synthetase LanKC [Streptomyces fuscichromogenes]|uniref:class III lanthionine synthetase LanKC n=1 Tax=Streptomyces fuscichromogenes TaxID=1324013 RepID=UPI0037FC3B20